MRATFSGSPSTKTIGIWRVALVVRSQTATSRPADGEQVKSTSTPAGEDSRISRKVGGPGTPTETW